MGDAVTILVLLVLAGAFIALFVPPFNSYSKNFFGEFGTDHAKRVIERRRQGRGTIPERPQVLDSGWAQEIPLAALETTAAGRRASTQAGPTVAQPLLFLRIAGGEALMMGEGDAGPRGVDRRTNSDLAAHVAELVALAAEEVRSGSFRGLAIVMRLPITDSWETDRAFDLRALFSEFFSADIPVSVAYEEPLDVSSWPAEVLLRAPGGPGELLGKLTERGFNAAAGERMVVAGDALRMGRATGADALLVLANLRATEIPMAALDGNLPAYSSLLALALDAGTTSQGQLERISETERSLAGFIRREQLVLVGADSHPSFLPLTPFRGVVHAWQDPTVGTDPAQTPISDRFSELEAAVSEKNELVAAAILATEGRAWIETGDASTAVRALYRARTVFGTNSSAGAWSHYLIALDAALRLNEPGPHWFDDSTIEEVEVSGFRTLFTVEQGEFARLTGDLATATHKAGQLWAELDKPVETGNDASVYRDATSRFVLASILRSGGRYDLARRLIDEAIAVFNEAIPAHRVELIHCRYALSICNAVDGFPRIETGLAVEEGEEGFARSLVQLANAQASWFIGDLERAKEFAAAAQVGFDHIGYGRHSRRATKTKNLFDAWEAFDKGEGAPSSVDQLPMIREAVLGTAALDLSGLRPAAALTAISFATRFSDGQLSRAVHLPALISVETDFNLVLDEPRSYSSVGDAEAFLKAALGVGAGRPVPMMPS